MASSAFALPAYDPAQSAYNQPAPTAGHAQAQPHTSIQQIKQLEEQGESVNQIADQMGLPVALVQSDLGNTTTSTAALPAAAVSIKA
jgi:hypothetical protein